MPHVVLLIADMATVILCFGFLVNCLALLCILFDSLHALGYWRPEYLFFGHVHAEHHLVFSNVHGINGCHVRTVLLLLTYVLILPMH